LRGKDVALQVDIGMTRAIKEFGCSSKRRQ
jgi:hypothetical protein